MKVINLLKEDNNPIFSFEFFPPKTEETMASLLNAIEALKSLSPSYVSVTYGAGGSSRDKTIELVSTVKNRFGLEPMAHLTCVGSSVTYIRKILDRYKERGIQNILALRGDPPEGVKEFTKTEDGFEYAWELVRDIRRNYDFSIGVAGYPEKHIESKSLEEDLNHLKLKVDSGADFIITQLFFNNSAFFKFERMARDIGITVPIIPGIMPITNFNQIKRFTSMCGARIPDDVLIDLQNIKDDSEAVERYGTEYAVRQCRELLDKGAPGIHFYTLNKSKITISILENLTRTSRKLQNSSTK